MSPRTSFRMQAYKIYQPIKLVFHWVIWFSSDTAYHAPFKSEAEGIICFLMTLFGKFESINMIQTVLCEYLDI